MSRESRFLRIVLMVVVVCAVIYVQHAMPAFGLRSSGRDGRGGSESAEGSSKGSPAVPRDESLTREQKVQMIVESRNVPVNYFGMVVDEDDQPLGGVKVRYTVDRMFANGILPGSTPSYKEAASGADGRFAITGEYGWGLGIRSLEKDGYRYSEKGGRGGQYSGNGSNDYRPDKANPEIFTMVRADIGRDLVWRKIYVDVPCDGTSVNIDLSTRKVTEDGDLRFVVKRDPYETDPGGRHFAWSASVEVVGGGLSALSGQGTYRAPTTGYDATYSVQVAANSPEWFGNLRKWFYIVTKDGRYGRCFISLDVDQHEPTAAVIVRIVINPVVGSRLLETSRD